MMNKTMAVLALTLLWTFACGGLTETTDTPVSPSTHNASPEEPTLASEPALELPDPDDSEALRAGFLAGCEAANISKGDTEPWIVKTDPVARAYFEIVPLKHPAKYTCEQQYEALLKETWLSVSRIQNLEPVKYLTHLENTNIFDAQIDDLRPLLNNRHLRYLSVRGTDTLTDEAFEVLAQFPNLKQINIDSTRLSKIGFLTEMPTLKKAQLWRNQIADLSPIANLSNDVRVTVQFNPIDPELFCDKPATHKLVKSACSGEEGLKWVVDPELGQ